METKDFIAHCTKCFRQVTLHDAVECFGVIYHAKCAPKNVRGTKKVKP